MFTITLSSLVKYPYFFIYLTQQSIHQVANSLDYKEGDSMTPQKKKKKVVEMRGKIGSSKNIRAKKDFPTISGLVLLANGFLLAI